ncbi:muts domain V-domain-containing protein, partial [Leucosporidium creatinivorum]
MARPTSSLGSHPPTRPTSSTSRRAPSRTRTRSASAAPTTSGEEEGEWVLAILEGRGAGREVGVVGIERQLGKVFVTQYGDSSTYIKTLHLCTTRPPSLILVPQTSLTGSSSNSKRRGAINTLNELEGDAFEGVAVTGVLRKYWEEQVRSILVLGFEFIAQLTLQDDKRTGTILSIKPKYYALAAASALFKYLETSYSLIFPPRSLRIEYAPLDGTCMIDTETVKNLEVVANLLNPKSKQSLLGLMNKCYTPMATRLLRTNLLSPLTEVTTIDTRLDAVEELITSEERLTSIRKALEPLKSLDADKLIGQLITPLSTTKLSTSLNTSSSSSSSSDPSKAIEQKISRLLSLRTLLLSLPALRSALHHPDSSFLQVISKMLNDERAEEMLKRIGETVNEEALAGGGAGNRGKGALAGRNGRIYAVKAQKKLLLDVARETYKENLNDAFELCEEVRLQQGGLEGMSLQYLSGGGGFVFTVSAAEWDEKMEESAGEVGRRFLNVHKKGKKVEFTSMDLKKKNSRILESVQEIFLMSDEIINELFDEIRGSIACLYRASEAIAMLDMLASFADISSKNNYVRPEWTDTLAIKAGRHPLIEQFRANDGSFVPNDTYASTTSSFQIITGANMSGKSTLLRQIALMYIMAQVGCFVPATYASFRVVETLLSRLGNDDSIEASLSTFASEMSTMSMILGALEGEERSRGPLVLVDELGRGTSPEEGVGIAHALAERIIESKALCFFATHFKELTLTLSRYPNVVSLHLVTEIDRSAPNYSLTFHHRLTDGSTPLSHYGLELAKLAKLPSDVLARAGEVSERLAEMAREGRRESRGSRVARRRKLLLRLRTAIQDLYNSPPSVTGFDLMVQLKELQSEQVRILTATMVEPEPAPQDQPVAEEVEREGDRVDEETVEGDEELEHASTRTARQETDS